jgi:hypothetical protein
VEKSKKNKTNGGKKNIEEREKETSKNRKRKKNGPCYVGTSTYG